MRYLLKIISFILFIGILLSFSVNRGSNPNKDRLLLELISYVLERGHYNPRQIDDNFSKNVFNSYIKGLDNQRRFFLQSDIDNFTKYRYRIDDLIKNSDISFFDLTIEKLFQRTNQVNSFYSELLEKPFDFSKEELINLDFDNLPYSRTLNDLKKRWRMRFKLSALQIYYDKKQEENDKKGKDSMYQIKSDLALEREARESVIENVDIFFENVSQLERKDWFTVFVNSIALEFDPHTSYYAPQEKDRFDTRISGKFEGIGARLQRKNEQVHIIEIIPGGPVWRDNLLKVGEIILKVAQKDEEPIEIGNMRLDDAVNLIKGPKGTKVYLTVKKVDGIIEEVEIIRDVVELEESYAKSSLIIKDSNKYGLIELPQFYIDFDDYSNRNAAIDVKKEINQLKEKDVQGIIIDLRNNGGGSLKTVVDITGYFIKDGPVVQVKSTGGRKEILRDNDSSIIWEGPLVILVNEFSASASEILAAALQDYKRAIVLGSKQTFGKGTVQNMVDLNRIISGSTYGDLGAVKLTTDKFYRINGGSTQLEGVKSDVVILDRYSYIDLGEKDQENPLSWDYIEPTTFDFWHYEIDYKSMLERSENRMKSSQYISLIDEQAKWVKQQQDEYDYTLNYNNLYQEKEFEKKKINKFKKLNEFESGLQFEWLPEPGKKTINKEITLRRNRWIQSLKADFYIDEATNILEDLNSKSYNKLAQLKNSKN
ncbi:MAG: tail-specific protease [Flavobacteriaceae bacterium TMED184]|nr:MAG: tail-specific protease [Flavobacteriaceae bacterium TMED184]